MDPIDSDDLDKMKRGKMQRFLNNKQKELSTFREDHIINTTDFQDIDT